MNNMIVNTYKSANSIPFKHSSKELNYNKEYVINILKINGFDFLLNTLQIG